MCEIIERIPNLSVLAGYKLKTLFVVQPWSSEKNPNYITVLLF